MSLSTKIVNDALDTIYDLDLDAPEHDMSTYMGRVQHYWGIVDPRSAIVSDEEVDEAKSLIAAFESRSLSSSTTAEELTAAKKLCRATLHPDTQEEIFLPLRMNGLLFSNTFMCAGMLMAPTTALPTLFWQVANQSLNVGINYANRNAKTPISTKQAASGFAIGVGASVSIALGLRGIANKLGSPTLGQLVPFAAVALAGVANCFAMRWNEVEAGIPVYSAEGENLGDSRNAAVAALAETSAARMAAASPALLFPPFIMAALKKTSTFSKSPMLANVTNVGVVAGCLLTALPFALAAFPSETSVKAKYLEPQFQDHGEVVFFNRGL